MVTAKACDNVINSNHKAYQRRSPVLLGFTKFILVKRRYSVFNFAAAPFKFTIFFLSLIFKLLCSISYGFAVIIIGSNMRPMLCMGLSFFLTNFNYTF